MTKTLILAVAFVVALAAPAWSQASGTTSTMPRAELEERLKAQDKQLEALRENARREYLRQEQRRHEIRQEWMNQRQRDWRRDNDFGWRR